MKVFVSAKWELRDKVRAIYKLLEEKGHIIIEDWTLHNVVKPYNKDIPISGKNAIKDLRGVLEAGCLYTFIRCPRCWDVC